jgi:hypothetical protein
MIDPPERRRATFTRLEIAAFVATVLVIVAMGFLMLGHLPI